MVGDVLICVFVNNDVIYLIPGGRGVGGATGIPYGVV